MSFSDKQRLALIEERGQPALSLEFDVFDDNQVSMWTHFNHLGDFNEMTVKLIAIRDHLNEFLKDKKMCPFYKKD